MRQTKTAENMTMKKATKRLQITKIKDYIIQQKDYHFIGNKLVT